MIRVYRGNGMNIIVDAFGGDNAPLEIIKGSLDAKNEFGVDITLVGNEEIIRKVSRENELNLDGVKIVHAETVISQNEAGTEVVKSKKDCSMAVGLKMLHNGEGDAFVSAGNSGAVCVGATLIVKRIKGSLTRFIKEEHGVGVVEVVLILVVLIALVLIFKEQLGAMVTKAMDALEKSMNEILS